MQPAASENGLPMDASTHKVDHFTQLVFLFTTTARIVLLSLQMDDIRDLFGKKGYEDKKRASHLIPRHEKVL